MKTKQSCFILLINVVFFLHVFTGCNVSFDMSEPSISPEWAEPSDGPGYDDLVETDKLVLYIRQSNERVERRMINLFQQAYDVDVEIVTVSKEEYEERIINDLAAGSGPDVIFLYEMFYTDIDKAALNHSFLDLTNVLAEDPEFHKEDYLDGVFEACQHYGRQYVVPLSCELPLVASIRSDLEELGFRWDGVDTMSDLLEESVRVTPKAEVNSNFQQMFCSKNTFQRLLLFSSIPVINYETGEVLPDEKNFRDFLESYKLYFPYDYNEADRAMYHRALGYDVLTAGRCAFVFPRNMDGLPATLSVLKNESYDYVIHSIPGQTKESVGIVCGPVAINANSKNTLNAYRFIKFILSETSQKDRYTIPDGMPILKKALYDGLVNSTGFTRGPGGNAMPDYEDRAFTEDEAEMIMELITGTDRFVLNLSNEIIEMVCDTMLPFFQNEASYEFCLNDLRSKLTFYLSE